MKKNEKKIVEKINREYPTKEEYFQEVARIQSEELKSDRYTLAYEFLKNNYWDRKNKNLEDELFKIIEIEDPMYDKSDNYKKDVRMKKFELLKQFMNSLTDDQLESNIFLKYAKIFKEISILDCSNIIRELNNKIKCYNGSPIQLNCQMTDQTQKCILEHISTQTCIKYYRPQDYKLDYINVLDPKHQYVYNDYNMCVNKIIKLVEDIYFLQINDILYSVPSAICYHFQVYNPGHYFIVNFFTRIKDNQVDDEVSEQLDPIDKIIRLIRSAKTEEEARKLFEQYFDVLMSCDVVQAWIARDRREGPIDDYYLSKHDEMLDETSKVLLKAFENGIKK